MPFNFSGLNFFGDVSAQAVFPPPPPPVGLFAWGSNNGGQLGLGNTTYYSSPKQVDSVSNWSSISTGYGNSISIKTNGALWSWGGNGYGKLGLGDTAARSSPVQVGALTNWASALAGPYGAGHTLAVKTDGTLWGWGQNSYGRLGFGNQTTYSSPKQVGALTNWSKVASGQQYALAIKTNGTLWALGGRSAFGALGLGNETNYSSPKQIGSLTNWLNVSCGNYHNIAIKTDGTLWSWGHGGYGKLGLSNSTSRSSPVQVGSDTNWYSVAAGPLSSASIKTDGTLWTWARNLNGQLGLGDTEHRSSPTQVGALTNWLKLSAGYSNCAAIKTNGSLWAWGNNANGQLGLGNSGSTTSRSSPVQVGSLTNWSDVGAGGSTFVLAILS